MPHLPDRHHDHDPALIAAFAAGDTTGAEHTRASELVASCTACAGLRDDLVAIAAAVRTLPAPRRTRDYRLTAEQAARLRPAGWRRLLAPMAGPRFRLAAPLGTTMATLGVAGLLLAAMPGTMLPASPAGGEAAGGSDRYGGGGSVMVTGGSAQPEASDGALPPAASGEPNMSAAPSAAAVPSASAGGAGQQPAATPKDRRQSTAPSPMPVPTALAQRLDSPAAPFAASAAWPLALASGVLFLLGAALVIARLVARHLATT